MKGKRKKKKRDSLPLRLGHIGRRMFMRRLLEEEEEEEEQNT
jgi:hypothetical protein